MAFTSPVGDGGPEGRPPLRETNIVSVGSHVPPVEARDSSCSLVFIRFFRRPSDEPGINHSRINTADLFVIRFLSCSRYRFPNVVHTLFWYSVFLRTSSSGFLKNFLATRGRNLCVAPNSWMSRISASNAAMIWSRFVCLWPWTSPFR